jgi:alpha-tubulin suppressor-like RCC1 family protein
MSAAAAAPSVVPTAGEVFAWGLNKHGALGLGDELPRHEPARVALPALATAVACGAHFSAALLVDGRVVSWGKGAHGRLGRGGTHDAHRPGELAGAALPRFVGLAGGCVWRTD